MRTRSIKSDILRIVVMVLTLAITAAVYAQKHQVRPDPMTLDYETNLAVPEVPVKQAVEVSKHMLSICEALRHMGYDTEMSRQNQVVTLIIPCSELFAPNDTVLKATGQVRLSNLSKLLIYPTMYKLIVSVYADDTGDRQYTDALTASRANAIDAYLLDLASTQGVSRPNIVPYGMGQGLYRAENNSIDHRTHNRRVEIAIVPEYEMITTAKSGKLNK